MKVSPSTGPLLAYSIDISWINRVNFLAKLSTEFSKPVFSVIKVEECSSRDRRHSNSLTIDICVNNNRFYDVLSDNKFTVAKFAIKKVNKDER